MQVVSVGRAHPPFYYTQSFLLEQLQQMWAENPREANKLERFFTATTVQGRYVSQSVEEFNINHGFGERNNVFITQGTEIAEKATRDALQKAGLEAKDVDAIFFSSVTGIAVPTIDARLIHRMGFRDDVKRFPFFGLGCVAGAAGSARVNDYLLGHKADVALLICLELCSMTIQPQDYSVPNLVATALFGDGCAAMLAVGSDHTKAYDAPGPKIIDSRSRIYPDSERVMGWDISASGFKIVLSSGVPEVVNQYLADDVDLFLRQFNMQRSDISSWVCHPGGPKVIDAIIESLALEEYDLQLTRDSLASVGNMSSASVLFVLADTIEKRRPASGEKGLMMAMGPGFVSELVLIEW